MLDLELKLLLMREAKRFGIDLNENQLNSFLVYLNEIKRWSKRVNITGIRNDKEIIIKHFLDSIIPLKFISKHSYLVDIGSGAGFPGIPLKIAEQSLKVLLMDSIKKRVFFLMHIIRLLKLNNISAIHQRAERKKHISPNYKSDEQIELSKIVSFDVVIVRALGPVESVIKICTPYIAESGILIVMRGKVVDLSKTKFKELLHQYNLRISGLEKFSLPMGFGERSILILEKTS